MANKNRKFADGVQVSPVSRAELRAEARKIRKWLKIEDVDYLPVPRLLEVLQALLDDFEFFICEKPDLPQNTFASYVPSVHCVVIKEAFYDMACRGDGFARSTIVHEISHHILHRNQLGCLARKTDVPHKPYEDSEWQANVFACELLIPHYRLHDGMTVDDVVERFGVTPAAAKSALKNYSR